MTKNKNKKLKVAVIREELVELTGDAISALILNQSVLAHDSTEEMDKGTKEVVENLISAGQTEMAEQLQETSLRDGWFYKSPNSFYKEIMISSRSTVKRRLGELVEKGWLIKGGQFFKQLKNKKGEVIEDSWWKVNISKLRKDLFMLGYALYGYPIWSPDEEATEPDQSEQGGVHHEQGGVHHEQGGVHHEHQHRLLHRSSIEFEEEEETITLDNVTSFLNQQITKREITNPKTLKAIEEVATKCRAIGTNDIKSMENFCITVVEEKMSKFGQKQREVKKSNSKDNKPVRTELLPKWFDENETQQPTSQQNKKDPAQVKRELEDMLKRLRA